MGISAKDNPAHTQLAVEQPRHLGKVSSFIVTKKGSSTFSRRESAQWL
jgi:hypothetical protein